MQSKPSRGRQCSECYNYKQRKRRMKDGNKSVRKYEKTKKGFLMRTYRNMLSRVSGLQRRNAHLYEGHELLDKQEFYSWSLINPDFLDLFKEWEKSGYDNCKGPSIDRIDPRRGYNLLNMQWVSRSENSKRAAAFRYYGKII